MDLIGFIYGFGGINGLVLAAFLLYSPGGNRLANSFMAALVTFIALRFLTSWLIRADFFMDHPSWALIYVPLEFAWGPLLYLYACTVSGRPIHLHQSIHFLPALLLASGPISFANYPHADQVAFLDYFWSDRSDSTLGEAFVANSPAFWRVWIDYHLHGAFFTLQFGAYCYLTLRQIGRHNLSMEHHYSFTDQINLRWLRTLTYLCVFFLVLFLAFNRSRLIMVGHFDVTELIPNAPFLFLVLAIYIIGILALRQPVIQQVSAPTAAEPASAEKSEPEADTSSAITEQPTTGKYARSGISLEDAQRFKIRLMEAMQNQELYLDCDLTLGDLAEAADMTYHQASQVINGQMNQKFFSFVNTYRIQRARELLSDPKTSSMPIVELALEVGFKSKSSFYDAFKKSTEMTPTQFKKSLEPDAG